MENNTCLEKQPLCEEMLEKMNAYWRAANYLSAGQLYLLDNPLLPAIIFACAIDGNVNRSLHSNIFSLLSNFNPMRYKMFLYCILTYIIAHSLYLWYII